MSTDVASNPYTATGAKALIIVLGLAVALFIVALVVNILIRKSCREEKTNLNRKNNLPVAFESQRPTKSEEQCKSEFCQQYQRK